MKKTIGISPLEEYLSFQIRKEEEIAQPALPEVQQCILKNSG
jgi:hypothetical protein